MKATQHLYSIKDLENLSGVKAHTIRIWEKRYALLNPERTDTNIRVYSERSLTKLLNVAFLNKNGYKISKIAELKPEEIDAKVESLAAAENLHNYAIQDLKLSMMQFDYALFNQTYQRLIRKSNFRDVMYQTFIPFLEELGLLWQSGTISPANEHFISNLIKQKILLHIERLKSDTAIHDNVEFVLFLPDNEIHDIGLLFLNFELLLHGFKTIYLGPSNPINSLTPLVSHKKNLVFISYFTVKPEKDELKSYLKSFHETLNSEQQSYPLWILGRMVRDIDTGYLQQKQHAFFSIQDAVNKAIYEYTV